MDVMVILLILLIQIVIVVIQLQAIIGLMDIYHFVKVKMINHKVIIFQFQMKFLNNVISLVQIVLLEEMIQTIIVIHVKKIIIKMKIIVS